MWVGKVLVLSREVTYIKTVESFVWHFSGLIDDGSFICVHLFMMRECGIEDVGAPMSKNDLNRSLPSASGPL